MSANVCGIGVVTKGGPTGQHRWRWATGQPRCGHCLAGLGTVLTLLLGSGPASATPIDTIPSTGLVIDQTGTYHFTQDLFHGDSQAAIRITASNVVLDLNGHTLSGSGSVTNETIGIEVRGAQNVAVRNGTISGFNTGIFLFISSNNTIDNNQGLLAKLKVALAQLEKNHESNALDQLDTFIEHVQAMIPDKLPPTEGQLLIDAAQRIIHQLNC